MVEQFTYPEIDRAELHRAMARARTMRSLYIRSLFRNLFTRKTSENRVHNVIGVDHAPA